MKDPGTTRMPAPPNPSRGWLLTIAGFLTFFFVVVPLFWCWWWLFHDVETPSQAVVTTSAGENDSTRETPPAADEAEKGITHKSVGASLVG